MWTWNAIRDGNRIFTGFQYDANGRRNGFGVYIWSHLKLKLRRLWISNEVYTVCWNFDNETVLHLPLSPSIFFFSHKQIDERGKQIVTLAIAMYTYSRVFHVNLCSIAFDSKASRVSSNGQMWVNWSSFTRKTLDFDPFSHNVSFIVYLQRSDCDNFSHK